MLNERTLRTAGLTALLGLLAAAVLAPSAAASARPGWQQAAPATSAVHAPLQVDGRDPVSAADELPAGPLDDSAAGVSPTQSVGPGPTPPNQPGDGEISIDGPFVTPAPSATPSGAVLGASGVPELTPPPTDTVTSASTVAGGGFQLLLLALAGLSSLPLIVRRVPVARRS